MNNLNEKTLIIAEAGVNHNGCLETAKKMIEVAQEAGADAVKFQTFKAENLLVETAEKADYQKCTTDAYETQFNMIKKLELNVHCHEKLAHYCKRKNVLFLSTPFDLESVDLLNKLNLQIYKIASGEITNWPLLNKIGKLNKPVILSSGMSTIGEIENALVTLKQAGLDLSDITVMHCHSEYPTKYEDVNLKAMLTIGNAFPGIHIGYSDHTPGIEIPIAAVAMGASVIEKHFTLDRNMEGPDHSASLEPDELKEMVKAIRNIQKAMGDGLKKPGPNERKNIQVARKSIVASKRIEKGEIFCKENLTVKRPGTGISPMLWNDIIGKVANRSFNKNDFILCI